jgi:hypothetical protein
MLGIDTINEVIAKGGQEDKFFNAEISQDSVLLSERGDSGLNSLFQANPKRKFPDTDLRIKEDIDTSSFELTKLMNSIQYPFFSINNQASLLVSEKGFSKINICNFFKDREVVIIVQNGKLNIDLTCDQKTEFSMLLEKGDVVYLPSRFNFEVASDSSCSLLVLSTTFAKHESMLINFSDYLKSKGLGFKYFYAAPDNLDFSNSGKITNEMLDGWKESYKEYFDKYYLLWAMELSTTVSNQSVNRESFKQYALEHKNIAPNCFLRLPGSRVKFMLPNAHELILSANGRATRIQSHKEFDSKLLNQLCSTINPVNVEDFASEFGDVFAWMSETGAGIRL